MLQTFGKKELSGAIVKNSTAGMAGGIYRSISKLDLSGNKSMTGPTINFFENGQQLMLFTEELTDLLRLSHKSGSAGQLPCH
jgi:hypothetical protein